jgi:hypothetical protein
VLAVTAGIVMLAAACGGSPSSTSGTGVSAQFQQDLAFAQCMRSHGVPNYPDPNVSLGAEFAQLGINPNSPHFQAALRTCDRLVPPPSQGGGS